MIIPADLPLPPVSGLDDVPIQREVIGGAGTPTMGSQYPSNECLFRRYVYRGIGVDIYETPKPKPKPKPEPEPKPKRVKYPRKPKRPPNRLHYRPEPKPPWWDEQELLQELEQEPAPKPAPKPKTPLHARSASGWKPLTGTDLDDLLAEMED